MSLNEQLKETASHQERLLKKWAPLIDYKGLAPVKSYERKAALAQMLENQNNDTSSNGIMLSEAAPTNSSGAFPAATNLKGYDPLLINLVRRALPNMIGFDIASVQPMSGPTGLIFALRSKYSTMGGTEALYNETDTSFSGTGTHAGTNPGVQVGSTDYTPGTGFSTATGEALGDGVGADMAEMAISIDKVTATAKTRALRAQFTMEIQQDLKAVHGLDAEAELTKILSTEITAEINREFVRTIYNNAKIGAQVNTALAGTFNLDLDSNGRWMVEKIKGLMFQIERDANVIGQDTRRGRGNILLVSGDVASALSLSGLLDSSGLQDNLSHDGINENTFVGILNKRFKVYVDPYVAASATNYYVVGFRGSSAYDAGLFYCPYVPLQLVRAVDPRSFQPKIAFKTRYAIVANPFASSAGDGVLTYNTNFYYRRAAVTNLM